MKQKQNYQKKYPFKIKIFDIYIWYYVAQSTIENKVFIHINKVILLRNKVILLCFYQRKIKIEEAVRKIAVILITICTKECSKLFCVIWHSDMSS